MRLRALQPVTAFLLTVYKVLYLRASREVAYLEEKM
jgi:hypothetical protein